MEESVEDIRSQKSSCNKILSSESEGEQYVDIIQVKQTRRVLVTGHNIREFTEILKRVTETIMSLKISPTDQSRGVITFKSVVSTSIIKNVLSNSGLDLKLFACKSTSKKISDRFLSSSSSSQTSSSSQLSFQGDSLSQHSHLSSNHPSSSMYNKKIVSPQSLLQPKQKNNKQSRSYYHHKEQQLHQCTSNNCCLTLLEMVKNQNINQVASHLCKAIMKNGWCIHQLSSYVDKQVLDIKLNEQVFHIIVEQINEIKNSIELGGNINTCKECKQAQNKINQIYYIQQTTPTSLSSPSYNLNHPQKNNYYNSQYLEYPQSVITLQADTDDISQISSITPVIADQQIKTQQPLDSQFSFIQKQQQNFQVEQCNNNPLNQGVTIENFDSFKTRAKQSEQRHYQLKQKAEENKQIFLCKSDQLLSKPSRSPTPTKKITKE